VSSRVEAAVHKDRRQPNRRGQGDRLRADLLVAAMEMVESQDIALSLRGVARQVGIAATSVYLHFPDLDHLLAAVIEVGFTRLTEATSAAGQSAVDPADELRKRCRTYCHFGLDHSRLYRLMFQAGLPLGVWADPAATPGRRSFENLVSAVERCIDAGLASKHDDPFRLASLIWTGMHGIILARISRPTFPWAAIDDLVDEMVNRMAGLRDTASSQAAPSN